MTGRQRVLEALRGEVVRPRPVGALTQGATVELMEATGERWPEAHAGARAMAALAAGAREVFGFDLVRVPFDQTIEAELFGCPVAPGTVDEICAVRGTVSSPGGPVPRVPRPTGRAEAVAGAISILRARFGDEAVVLGGLVGPFTLTGHLLGITPLLTTSLTDPGALAPFLEAAVSFGTEYAARQVRAGADAVVVEEMAASLDLTSPRIFGGVVLPALRKLIAAIDAPVVLHICGNNTRILPLLVESGARALSLDARTDLAAAVKAGAGRCAVAGGVPPIEALLSPDPGAALAASRESLGAGVHLLAPGCGIPPRAPTANLKAMVRAVREWKE